MIFGLAKCRFVPGTFAKRFARDLAAMATNQPDRPLSERQLACLKRQHHTFRRQIPSHRCTEFCRVNELPGSLE